jgi:predicted ATPase
MRIDRVWLKSFRNLVDVDIEFDETSNRQVIVGRNGVGKSNLLEAITRIFRDLDLEQPSSFGYEIEYYCNDHVIAVTCTSSSDLLSGLDPETFSLQVRTAAASECPPTLPRERRPYRPMNVREFFRCNRPIAHAPNPQRLLPLYVFGYYSGSITRFAEIFETHEERYYREQITGEEAPLRSLFQAKPHHSQFALLAFYATHDEGVQEFLERECRIVGFSSALFALREPYWKASPKQSRLRKKIGDSRFWFAGGKVAPFLDTLFANSFAPMAGKERVKVSIGQEKTKERRFSFIPDQTALQQLASGLTNKEFFARLESLVFSDLVSPDGSDLRVWIGLKDCDSPATFKDLAEGERQLLTVLGLMRFTAEKEALFLLDEPDTHLNPAWCLDYLDNLRLYGAEPANSQILMTTHSPLTFAGLEKNEVVILERDLSGRIYAEHPTSAPKGMGFGAILTSDYFGLRSTLDKGTLAKIDEKRMLTLKTEWTDRDRERIAQLNDELGKLDFSQAARDPLYLEFIRAMTAAQQNDPSLRDAAPKKASWRKRQEVARDIAKRLLNAKIEG